MRIKAILSLCLFTLATAVSADEFIKINTDQVGLVLRAADNGRLYQSYLGKRLANESDLQHLPKGNEAYLTHGMEDYFEPAIEVHHNDANPSLLLKYVSHTSKNVQPGVDETVITLQDDKYPVTVKLHYVAYAKENIIKTFTEISHQEKKPLKLERYASAMLHFSRPAYYLTEFSGDWIYEATMSTTPLNFGKKVLDTKLGARANMFTPPMFILSLDKESSENEGEVILGTLGWTGNFRFTFEVDNKKDLRVIAGINPYFSEYSLPKGETFRTPDFYFTYSDCGRGQASRNFHDWARKYQLKDGQEDRMTLLNNWEATYFDFNEDKLVELMGDAVKLGVDMFLLDDGWFGNKYERHSDTQGLGDWDETQHKLPHGIQKLVDEAAKRNIKFGIWIEPEMVSPKSELYEKHKDWVIHLPNRDEYYFRNQMVLDLSNPEVQDFVFGVVDGLMTKYPGIAYFKWDCNSPITNIYSPYLKDKQTHLYVDYVRGLYKVLDRIKAKYPKLPMMLCSGGSRPYRLRGIAVLHRVLGQRQHRPHTTPVHPIRLLVLLSGQVHECPRDHMEQEREHQIPHGRGHDGQARFRHQAQRHERRRPYLLPRCREELQTLASGHHGRRPLPSGISVRRYAQPCGQPVCQQRQEQGRSLRIRRISRLRREDSARTSGRIGCRQTVSRERNQPDAEPRLIARR